MEKDDEFLHTFFNYVSQLCYEKAKEHLVGKSDIFGKFIKRLLLQEKDKEPKFSVPSWAGLLNILQQLSLAEKSYMEIGFLQNKHKSFLRKDVGALPT